MVKNMTLLLLPLRAWNMSTFVTRRSDICYKAVGVSWSKPGLSDHNDIGLVNDKETDLFLMDLMFIRLPVKSLV